MIVKHELQYLFGVHLMDAVSSQAHLWAYANKLTPEQAVIAHIRAGFYQIMANHPNDSYFDEAFSGH